MTAKTKNPRAASVSRSRPKTSRVRPIPKGMHTATPHLVCAGAAAAIEFYKKAFGAVEEMRLPGPDGKLLHARINIGDSKVFLIDESPMWGARGPKLLKGTPVTIHLYVENADGVFARAVKAGAKVREPLQDMFWGDRYGVIEDPFGHSWSIATRIRELSPGEIQEAAKQLFGA